MPITRRTLMRSALTVAASAVALPATDAEAQDDPLGVRGDFPVVNEGVYLNSAYITPPPTPVTRAGQAFLEQKSVKPISLGDMLAKTDEVRGQFARLVGAAPDEIGFLFATSEGENLVARSLDLRAGDNVVIDALQYDTAFVLYRHLEATRGIELRIVPARSGSAGVDDFARRIDRRTKLVSVTYVSHQNGFRHDMRPLADLAHAHGAWLYTDAIQAVGMFPIDVKADGIDVMATGTYKWLLGSYGVAPLYVRRELLDRIVPDRFGALHVTRTRDDYHFDLAPGVKGLEYATLAFGPIYQLGEALRYLDRVGVARIEAHTVGLASALHRGLTERGFVVDTPAGNRSSIVSVRVGQAQEETRKILAAARVQVSLRENGRQIRVSPALFNNTQDIAAFLKVAERLT